MLIIEGGGGHLCLSPNYIVHFGSEGDRCTPVGIREQLNKGGSSAYLPSFFCQGT